MSPLFNGRVVRGCFLLVIERVRIKNFRSIVNGEFEPDSFNVIVGENDVGKSNYLRALNLFFNNETDVGLPFSFSRDFSRNAAVGKGKAQQIEIALYITPPDSFSDQREIVWRRYWRDDAPSFMYESFKRYPGAEEIDLKTKAIQWLKRFRYRYVPAIKGRDYFTSLMRDLHDILSETVDERIRAAAKDFIGVVRENTLGISKHLASTMDIESELELPENLRSLFEVLDFSTGGSTPMPLQLRGDGIKVRHIPAILRFLAEQELSLSAVGKPRPTAIWGYEEPENNLEMKRAFQHADELFEATAVAQVFITTHSPAFYRLANAGAYDGVAAFHAVFKPDYGTQLEWVDSDGIGAFDTDLGLMPLVAPYIEQKVLEVDALTDRVRDLSERVNASDRLLVLVAGETDKIYLQAAIRVFSSTTLACDVECVGMVGKKGSVSNGDSNLIRVVQSLDDQPMLLSKRVLAIFDCDVKSPPQPDHKASRLRTLWLERRAENKVAQIGIENLLPDYVFEESFYSKTVIKKDYGESVTKKTLNKKKLCEDICTSGGRFYNKRKEVLKHFEPIVSSIKILVDPAESG